MYCHKLDAWCSAYKAAASVGIAINLTACRYPRVHIIQYNTCIWLLMYVSTIPVFCCLCMQARAVRPVAIMLMCIWLLMYVSIWLLMYSG